MRCHTLPESTQSCLLTPFLCLQILSEDYAKAAFLCADRSICLHAKYGAHYRTRIPTAGRDLAYVASTAGAPPEGCCRHPFAIKHRPLQSPSACMLMAEVCWSRSPSHSGVCAGGQLGGTASYESSAVSADLIIVGSAPEAYRLNLSEGRFLAPLPLSSGAANAVRVTTETGIGGCSSTALQTAAVGCQGPAEAVGSCLQRE